MRVGQRLYARARASSINGEPVPAKGLATLNEALELSASSRCRRASSSLTFSSLGLEEFQEPFERDLRPLGPVVELVADLVDALVEEVGVQQDPELRRRLRQQRSLESGRCGEPAAAAIASAGRAVTVPPNDR